MDLWRGVVMIIMALDHTREFFGVPGVNPTDPATASAALFFTRWITHLCAPAFFLLAGTGAALSLGRRSKGDVFRFLVTRGLWLVFLELTVVRTISYQFNVDYHVTLTVVLWALGWSMVALAPLLYLPTAVTAAIGLVTIAGHNLLDGIRFTSPLGVILHGPGFLLNEPGRVVFVTYPLVPWIGVTALGLALGAWYRGAPDPRRKGLLIAGAASIIAFAALRTLNLYGDPSPWSAQATNLRSALSFLNTSKYPPSLLFLLMTLGPGFLFLAWADRGTPRAMRWVLAFGRTPLFFYVVHFFLIHALAAVACLARYGTARYLFESPDLANAPFTAPPDWGYSLPTIYLIWIAVVAAMLVPCRALAEAKARRAHGWLRYL